MLTKGKLKSTRSLDKRVVITGLGVVSCCGVGMKPFWESVRDGVSGLRYIESFDASGYKCQVAGEVPNFDPRDYVGAKDAQREGRFVHYAIAAAREAVEDSGVLSSGTDPYLMGAAFGSGASGLGSVVDLTFHTAHQESYRAMDATAVVEMPAHATTSHVSIEFGLKGPSLTNSTGCVTSIVSVSQAMDVLRSGAAKVMVAGGSEAPVGPIPFFLLCKLGVLSPCKDGPTKSCKPYDLNRDGLVLGEGGSAMVVETARHAMDRGAHIYAEVLSTAHACEAHHMVIALPTGEELAQALRVAMADARIGPTDIDYVCSHGIGSKQYDEADTRALKLALGDHAYKIAVSSIKPVTGQPFAAAGGMQVAAVCMAIAEDIIPPTLNLETPDPDYVPGRARRARVDVAAINGHSYGGAHSAMLLRRFDPDFA
jgi:3-oxoacyl-[acyl-carrier-protein] synthase II